jgi:hypothetical protein
VRFGSWHGDWGPWNMAWAGERVRLWDWERFTRGVPYGFDALHYALPALPPQRPSPARLREAATAALAPFGTGPADAALVLALYVAALCGRFLPDSHTQHGAQLTERVAGLLDLLDLLLSDDTDDTGERPARYAAVPAAGTDPPTPDLEERP